MKNLQNICSFAQLFQLKYLFSLRKWLRAQAQARECVITAPRGQLSARRLSGFLFLATPRVDTWQQQQLSQSESAGFLGWARGLAAPRLAGAGQVPAPPAGDHISRLLCRDCEPGLQRVWDSE